MSPIRRLLLGLALLVCAERAAIAQNEGPPCSQAQSREVIANCLVTQLRDSDVALNAAYAARLQQSPEEARRALVLEQRAWLHERDQRCDLRAAPTDREQWLQWLEQHQDRMICVTRFARLRIEALQGAPAASLAGAAGRDQSAAALAPNIQSARYASPHGQSFDVTTQLQSLCRASPGACSVSCGNQLAGDPDFGTPKYCQITYRCEGRATLELQIPEGQRALLACRTPTQSSSAAPASGAGNAAGTAGPLVGGASSERLLSLVKAGDLAALQTYLSAPGVDINARPFNDKALLDYAAELNQAAVVRYLIEHGARVNAAQSSGMNAGTTALHRAAFFDAVDVAALLLAHGANINAPGPAGATPLAYAASNGSLRVAELLVAHGAEVNASFSAAQTPLSEAEAHGHLEIAQLLLAHGARANTRGLLDAAAQGHLAAVQLALAGGADQATLDQALRFAVLGDASTLPGTSHDSRDRQAIITALLSRGADIDNRFNHAPNIPLMLATGPQMVDFLLDHGANREAHLSGAELASDFACSTLAGDPIGMMQTLIAHGIDIAGAPATRVDGLECALQQHRPDVAEFLRQHHVAVGPVNAGGKGP